MLTTEGRRIYAIGDIHGCLEDLRALLTMIEQDLSAAPTPDPLLVFVGDYTDRGPDSPGVIDALIQLQNGPWETVCLLGNHDQMFVDYLDDPAPPASPKYHWLDEPLGGDKTLVSYGVPGADPAHPGATHTAFRAAVPPDHSAFLRGLALYHQIGSYAFVHAGIRPDIPLGQQAKQDLIWIRQPFLTASAPHTHTIVHGHTPVREIEHHGNRINIDTGAVFGWRLSCLVLEGAGIWDLRDAGRLPIKASRV